MGYMRHHTIIVSGLYGDCVDKAHKEAKEIFGDLVSEIVDSPINGVCSFFVAPDGSKEGWPESNDGDYNRFKFKIWLNKQRYEDDSSPLSWVEVFYGDEMGVAEIVTHDREVADANLL